MGLLLLKTIYHILALWGAVWPKLTVLNKVSLVNLLNQFLCFDIAEALGGSDHILGQLFLEFIFEIRFYYLENLILITLVP